MKVVPKFQKGSSIVQQSDNTQVNTPVRLLPRKASDRIQSGLEIIQRLVPRQNTPIITEDNRTEFEKRRDAQEADKASKEYDEAKRFEQGMKEGDAFFTFISPSTWFGPAVRNNGKPYWENVASGEGFGNTYVNAGFDIAIPFALGGARYLWKKKQFESPNQLSTRDYIYHDKTNNVVDNSGSYHFQRLLNGGYQKVKQQGDVVSNFPVRIYHVPSQRSDAYKTILTRTDGKVSSQEVNQILDNVFYGTSVDFENKPLGIVLTDKSNFTSNIISHELDHAIHIPSEFPKGFNRNAPDYLLSNNGSELAARGSQIKDYFKLTNPDQPITEDMLKYAAQNYVKDTGIDNNMTEFFNNITDWKEAAKWLSKYATIVSLPILSSKEY